MNYVLITAARNEAAMIKGTIESVVAQTVQAGPVGHRGRRLHGWNVGHRRGVPA